MLCGACAVGGMSGPGRAWRSVRLSACLTGGQQKAGRAARLALWCAAVLRLAGSLGWWRASAVFSRKAFDGADGGQVILGGRPSLCTHSRSGSQQKGRARIACGGWWDVLSAVPSVRLLACLTGSQQKAGNSVRGSVCPPVVVSCVGLALDGPTIFSR